MSATRDPARAGKTHDEILVQQLARRRRSRLLAGTAIATGVIGVVMLAAPQAALATCSPQGGTNFIDCVDDPATETNSQDLNAIADGWHFFVGVFAPPGTENPGTIEQNDDGPVIHIDGNGYDGTVVVTENSLVQNESGTGSRRMGIAVEDAGAVDMFIDGTVDASHDERARVQGVIVYDAESLNVQIGETGSVTGANAGFVVQDITGTDASLDIINAGKIEGLGTGTSSPVIGEGIRIGGGTNYDEALDTNVFIDNTGTILGSKAGTVVGSGVYVTNSGNTHILNEPDAHIEGGLHGVEIVSSGHSDIENYSATSIVGAQSGMTITDSSSSFTWNTGKIQGLGDEGIDVNNLDSYLVINNGVDKLFNPDGDNALIEGYWDGIDISGVSGGTVSIDTLPSFIAPGDYNTIVRNLNGAYVHGLHGDGVDILDGNNILVYNNNSTIRGGDGTGATGDEGVQISERVVIGDEKKDTSYAVVFNTGSDALIQGRWDGVDIKDLWSDTRLRVDLPFAPADSTFFNTVVANFDNAAIQGIHGSGVDIFQGGNVLVYNDHASILGGFLNGKTTSGDHAVEIDGLSLIADYDVVYNTNNGLMRGNEDGVHIRNITRDFDTVGDYVAVLPSGVDFTVAVLNEHGSTIQGDNGDGVDVKYVTGNVLVANQGGSDSYILGNDNGVEVRHVYGGTGSEESAYGFVTISNNYLPTDGRAVIQGGGDWRHPILRVSDVSSNANVINGANGIIIANERPDSFLDDLSTFVDFAGTVDDAGMFSWSQFESVKGMLPDYYEVAHDHLAKLDEIGYSIDWDNAGWQVGRVKLEANQFITLNNPGVWFVSGRNHFNAGKTSTINNTQHGWIQTALNGEERERTKFYGLDLFNNTGSLLSMADRGAGDKTYISGDYNGADGYIGVDVKFGQPWDHALSYSQQKDQLGKADELKIGGDISGTSGLIIEQTNTEPGGINLHGIKVVKFKGVDNGNTCYDTYCLPGDTVTIDENSQYYALVDGIPMVLQGGGIFASYLTEKSGDYGDAFRLVTDWGPTAYQFPSLLTMAQGIWRDTNDVVDDHLHGNVFPTANGGPDDTMMTGDHASPSTALWIKGTGAWANRDTSVTVNPGMVTFDTSYDQNTYGLLAGADARPGGGNVRLGVFGGYVNSSGSFDSWSATANFDGGTAGAYAEFRNGGLYANAEFKGDFLTLDYAAPLGGGASGSAHVNSLGVMANIGYRMQGANAYIEPLASFAHVDTSIADMTIPGATIAFDSGLSTRAAAGVRVGTTLGGSGGGTTELSLTGKVGNEFQDANAVTISDMFGNSATFTDSIDGIYGQVEGEAAIYSHDRLTSAFGTVGALFSDASVDVTANAGFRKNF